MGDTESRPVRNGVCTRRVDLNVGADDGHRTCMASLEGCATAIVRGPIGGQARPRCTAGDCGLTGGNGTLMTHGIVGLPQDGGWGVGIPLPLVIHHYSGLRWWDHPGARPAGGVFSWELGNYMTYAGQKH